MAATNNTTTSGFVQVVADGVRLAYNQYGPPSAPNLVLIPGWAQTAAAFRKQVQHFQSRFRVTTYDHRGHGRVRQARLRVLVQLDLRDAALLGHSMGGCGGPRIRYRGAKIRIFGKEEGGSHFMLWEIPEEFNRVVEEFLASS
ncbi:Alpha/Beta hydrolase protein [Biscogniauxia mediterranea]|nr:Alpha/Beta hydrolase protein [Biscogniauxia mediterranea]